MVMLSCSALVRAQELVSSEQIGQASREELGELFGPFGGLVENSVTLYRILYTTPDIEGRTDTASRLLILPNRPDDVLPLICVQHGTVNSKSDVPSNLAGGYELGLSFGALGYVTVMPDFLGLGESRGFHPYVHADSEAWASLDMLLAVEAFAAQNGVLLNDQLFITGYSQGGHAGMALHRDIELNNSDLYTVTAASHMSGPYSISGIMRDLILGAAGVTAEQAPVKDFVSSGDKNLSGSLAEIGGKGLFTKEIEDALLTGEARFAVHSMKDMPAVSPPGLVTAAVPPREDPRAHAD